MPENYDLVISGAGSAGLSLAIYAARNGLKTLVLEKEKKPGVFPRGETLRPDPVVHELLGKDFMDKISFNRTALRRYYSPFSRHSFCLERENPSYIFHWADLTKGLYAEALNAGAEIVFSSKVKAPVIQKGKCVGVLTCDGREYFGNTIIGADGHESALGKFCRVDYESLNCPILKKIVKGVKGDYPGMEYFLLPRGLLNYAEDLPPSIAFIFPRGNGHAEIGLVVFSGLEKKDKRQQISRARLFEIFDKLSRTYPVFSEKVKDVQEEFRGISHIPMAGMHNRPSSVPGLLLMGDAVGLVEASGGCGIVATMKNAEFIAEFIKNSNVSEWNSVLMDQFNHEFSQTEIFRHIQKKYKKVPPVMKLAIGKKHPMFIYDLLWKIGKRIFWKV